MYYATYIELFSVIFSNKLCSLESEGGLKPTDGSSIINLHFDFGRIMKGECAGTQRSLDVIAPLDRRLAGQRST